LVGTLKDDVNQYDDIIRIAEVSTNLSAVDVSRISDTGAYFNDQESFNAMFDGDTTTHAKMGADIEETIAPYTNGSRIITFEAQSDLTVVQINVSYERGVPFQTMTALKFNGVKTKTDDSIDVTFL
jgi:hypothetical protein